VKKAVETGPTVSFSMKGAFIRDTMSVLNIPVVQHLAEQIHLTRLSIDDVVSGIPISAAYTMQFTFKGMKEFSDWYNSPSTRALFGELKSATFGGSFTSSLSMNRSSQGVIQELLEGEH
jgi:hypothetical protein